MSILYIAIDGDDVGRHLEYLMLVNDIDGITEFSIKYKKAMDWLVQSLIARFEASVVFSGGDNILASLSEEKFTLKDVELIRSKFSKIADKTLSIGIGNSAREAYFALKLSKSSGKNCTHDFKEFINV
jgi:GTP cyclohydrolase III